MFILKVTNKESGLVEQTNFTTKEQCLEFKSTLPYLFEDKTEVIPEKTEIKEAWIEVVPAQFDENGVEISPEQQINHKQETIVHPEETLFLKATHDFEIIENKHHETLEKIQELEAKITPRRLREAILGDKSFLEQINNEITELRKSL